MSTRGRCRPYPEPVADKADKKPQPTPYKERIDPGGGFGRQTAGLAALAGSPIGRALRRLGVDQGTLEQTKELEEAYRRLTEEPARISAALAPLGWIFFELAPSSPFAYHASARVAAHSFAAWIRQDAVTLLDAVELGEQSGGHASPGRDRLKRMCLDELQARVEPAIAATLPNLTPSELRELARAVADLLARYA
jgi:hypothetical protein